MKTIKFLFVILFSLAVAACGSSGDGSGGSSTPPTPAPTYSISGTVTYPAGMNTGTIGIRVIPCYGCSSMLGTVADSNGAYTVRGLQPGTYTVVAEMEVPGTVSPNATNPSGSTQVTISAANPNPTGVVVTLAAPSPVPDPGTPDLLRVAPGNNAAFVMYRPPKNLSGQEVATSYKIYWGTDATALTGGGIATFDAQGDRTNFYVLSDPSLTNNAVFYFKMSSFVGLVESALSAPSAAVTIGDTSVSNTVSVTVSSPGTATGTMVVGLYSLAGVYVKIIPIPNPASTMYTIAGVPDGTYFPFAVHDTNGDGVIGIGEFSNISNNFNGLGGLVTVVSGVPATTNIALSAASATAHVNTDHLYVGTDIYSLILGVNDGTKRAVAVTLVSGPNVAVPLDISANRVISLDTTTKPKQGDSYTFKVTLSDGIAESTETISASVSGVLDSFATNLTVTPTPSASIPTFRWFAPSPLPAAPYLYRLTLWGDADGMSWHYPEDFGLPSTTVSAVYNADGKAGSPTGLDLKQGYLYLWAVRVRDASGNSATGQAAPYTVP